MKYVWLLLFLTACTVGRATNILEIPEPIYPFSYECYFDAAQPCTEGIFENNALLAHSLILDRGENFTIFHDFTLDKGIIQLNVSGLTSYNNVTICDAYWSLNSSKWNSSCPRIHELVVFYQDDEEIFSIVATEKFSQYERSSAGIRVRFASPNSPYRGPTSGTVNEHRDGVLCRLDNLSEHKITIHYDFSTTYTQGIEYVNTADYIFITCDGEPGRPRIMDEIPIFQINKVVFRNQDESIPNEEQLVIEYFGINSSVNEWCGNGYCAEGEENICARDCGCSEGEIYWSNNSCTTDFSHIEYFGHYKRRVIGDYGIYNNNPGNFYIGTQAQNELNQLKFRGNEGADSITHASFGHGELALSEKSCDEYNSWNERVTQSLPPYEIGWSVLDEPTHRTHMFNYDAIDYVVSGINKLYPDMISYVVYNQDEPASEHIDMIGIDPYHFPYRTQGCEEFPSYYRMMHYVWNDKSSPTITHYEQFDKPIMLIGRSFETGQWSMPSECQQRWYYDTALGNPNIKGIIYFAWNHDAVTDVLDYNDPSLLQLHETLAENFTLPETQPPIIESTIAPGTWTEKNDYLVDENKKMYVSANTALTNGATMYTDEFIVETSQNTYSVRYYTQKNNEGNIVFEKGFLIDGITEILPNGERGHVGKIRDLDPNDYTMMPLNFAQNNLCNSFSTIIGRTGTVQSLVIDNQIFPIWEKSNYIYLAYEQDCSVITESCNLVDDNCNNLIDEYCYGDTDGDGQVTITDLLDAVLRFRVTSDDTTLYDKKYDLNNDDIINTVDYTQMVLHIG